MDSYKRSLDTTRIIAPRGEDEEEEEENKNDSSIKIEIPIGNLSFKAV